MFVQAKRFFEVLESPHGGAPWDEGDSNSMFIADRMFLITAIYHAIEDLQKLDIIIKTLMDKTFGIRKKL